MFNFGRDSHPPIDAIRIPAGDVNATALDRYGTADLSDDTNGSELMVNGALVFVYGRVNPIDQKGKPGETSVATKLWYEVYCKNCDRTLLGITGAASVNDVYWWQNGNHPATAENHPDDNNYTRESALALAITNGSPSDDLNFSVAAQIDKRFKVLLDLSRFPWLFHHPFDESNTTGFYIQFLKAPATTGTRNDVVTNPASGGHSGGRLGE